MTGLLDKLCEKAGIYTSYTDGLGQRHVVLDATKKKILQALNLPAQTQNHLQESLQNIQDKNKISPLLPVCIFQKDEAIKFPIICLSDEEKWHWTLKTEQGDVLKGTINISDLQTTDSFIKNGTSFLQKEFILKENLPLGYHTFLFTGEVMKLIITPQTCYLPDAFLQKKQIGLAIQLYAQRSERNWGIGDFTDLKHILSSARKQDIDVIGINPLHALFPENAEDAGPYSPSSRKYLNFLYLDIQGIEDYQTCSKAKDFVEQKETQHTFENLRQKELVDYKHVAALKRHVLQMLFEHFLKTGSSCRKKEFKDFCEKEGGALYQFALFEALSESLGFHPKKGWHAWEKDYQDISSEKVKAFEKTHKDKITFFQYVQWQTKRQFENVLKETKQEGLYLYQDLPIGVSEKGFEPWARKDVFVSDITLGVPPDDFNLHGQEWGLTPFSPKALYEKAYQPFIALLQANMKNAQMLRIDHIIGLYHQFWRMNKAKKEEIKGSYVSFPFKDLMQILALESQRNCCIVIGEDLGIVPQVVRETMVEKKILSSSLLYFERLENGAFKKPAQYSSLGVGSIGTHDLATLKGFFTQHDIGLFKRLKMFDTKAQREHFTQERQDAIQALFNAFIKEGLLEEKEHYHYNDLLKAAYGYMALSPSAVLLVQCENIFEQENQINVPGTYLEYPNWRQKLPLTVQEIFSSAVLKELVHMMRKMQNL